MQCLFEHRTHKKCHEWGKTNTIAKACTISLLLMSLLRVCVCLKTSCHTSDLYYEKRAFFRFWIMFFMKQLLLLLVLSSNGWRLMYPKKNEINCDRAKRLNFFRHDQYVEPICSCMSVSIPYKIIGYIHKRNRYRANWCPKN